MRKGRARLQLAPGIVVDAPPDDLDDVPFPDEGFLLPEDQSGQWEAAASAPVPAKAAPEAAAVSPSESSAYKPPRPDFGHSAGDYDETERRLESIQAEFYTTSDALREAAPFVLFTGDPFELGLRALLDVARCSPVPAPTPISLSDLKALTRAEPATFSDGGLYLYSRLRGTWGETSMERIDQAIQAYAGYEYGEPKGAAQRRSAVSMSADVVGSARKSMTTWINRPDFFRHNKGDPTGIALRSYFLHVRDSHLVRVSHSPWHKLRYGYDFDLPMVTDGDYDHWLGIGPMDPWWEKCCPVWHWLIGSTLPDQDDDIRFLQELMGGMLLGLATEWQMAAMFLGGGGNGKSTVMKAFQMLFPRGTVTSTNPGDWRESYDRTALIGKLLNICSETSAFRRTDALKGVITGDPIEARYTGQRSSAPFSYTPVAGHLFSANRLPDVSGKLDDGLLTKLEIVEFRQKFRGSDSQVTEGSILSRIGRELPGYVLWALHGAMRRLRDGNFTRPRRSKELKIEWRNEGDTVLTFLSLCCKPGKEEAFVGRSVLFKAYQQWCQDMGYTPRRIADAGAFKKIVNAAGHGDGTKGQYHERVYLDIALLPPSERDS